MYAQIIKEFMLVSLIGDEKIGLPKNDDKVFCVDIGNQKNIKPGMFYNIRTKKFFNKENKINFSELREQEYQKRVYKEDKTPLLVWQNKNITVDIANKKWLGYTAEGESGIKKSKQLTVLIAQAKEYIRNLYPEN